MQPACPVSLRQIMVTLNAHEGQHERHLGRQHGHPVWIRRPRSRALISSGVIPGAMTHLAISAQRSMRSSDKGSSSLARIPKEVPFTPRSNRASMATAVAMITFGKSARMRSARVSHLCCMRLIRVSDAQPCATVRSQRKGEGAIPRACAHKQAGWACHGLADRR